MIYRRAGPNTPRKHLDLGATDKNEVSFNAVAKCGAEGGSHPNPVDNFCNLVPLIVTAG